MTFPKFVVHILPGLRIEKTLSGKTINVSTSGTTSVPTDAMADIALKRFDEIQPQEEMQSHNQKARAR